MKNLILIVGLLGLVGCGKAGTTGAVAFNANVPAQGGGSQAPQSIPLTYYTESTTQFPISGSPTLSYTALGSCVVYLGTTYCWDDGIQSITQVISHNTFTTYYTYWGADDFNGNFNICNGGCKLDPMASQPSVITQGVALNVGNSKINAMLTMGTPHAVNCTLSGSTLNCVDFVINLNQTALD